jgi:hypothetical protein
MNNVVLSLDKSDSICIWQVANLKEIFRSGVFNYFKTQYHSVLYCDVIQ